MAVMIVIILFQYDDHVSTLAAGYSSRWLEIFALLQKECHELELELGEARAAHP